MTAQENKAIVRRYYDEVLNQGKVDLLEALAVPDYLEHNPFPGQAAGRSGLRQRAVALWAAFRPRFTLDDLIAEGDHVAVRWTNQGIHQGEFLGLPATGRTFTITGVDIHVLRDGKLAEHWDVVDQLSLLQQLGILPSPDTVAA